MHVLLIYSESCIVMHAVMHIVDCVRACSVLWKAVATKRDLVEKLHYVDTDVEVVIMTKQEGTWD